MELKRRRFSSVYWGEADVSVLGASVTDKKYDRPANPALSLLGDANTGLSSSLKCLGRRMMRL